jgi:hypothetical protein
MLEIKLIRKIAVAIIGIILSSGPIFCQLEEFKVHALRTKTQPLIDGILDEDIWQNAHAVSGFVQFSPDRGAPASLETVVKVLYDDDFIYFGFLCFDPDPGKVVLGMNKRDSITTGTDSVTVSIDTFNDNRTCYYFRTNPSGVQYDGRATENGQSYNNAWDGIWKSQGAWVEQGWSAEMVIPFKILKYQPGENRTWGIQFSRYVPRRFEKSFWTGPLEDYKIISTFGSLEGLDLKASSQKMEIVPYMISKGEERQKTDVQGGVDARYAFSQYFSGHLTINPDFATIEADQEQVNLTRFELNLLEKRNFFLEGGEIYQQRIRLFYSRRIADIYAGLKLYGKYRGYEISFLNAQSKAGEGEAESANFGVFRLKRDIMRSSNIGFLAANKLVNGRNQGAFGLDTSFIFTDTFRFTGQLAMSYGDRRDLAFFLRPSYDSSTFHIHIRYSYLGEYFGDNVNAVGFIRDDNRHELDSAIKKIIWLKNFGLEKIEYHSNYNIYWGMDKTLRSWDVFQALTLDFRNKFSIRLRHNQEFKLFEKEFRNHSSILELGYNTREWESMKLSYQFGKNFDSDFNLLSGLIRQNINQNLSLEYDLTRLSLDPDPAEESTWIHVVRVTQYFTKDLFLKVFYQINTVIEKKNIQVVFVYRFQPPFGAIQVAYQKGTAEFGERGKQGHTLFLKLAYIF